MRIGPVVWVPLNSTVDDPDVEAFGGELSTIFVAQKYTRKPASHTRRWREEPKRFLDYYGGVYQLIDLFWMFLEHVRSRIFLKVIIRYNC